MRRHCPLTKKSRKQTLSASSSIFGGPTKVRWRLQETEVYSKLYYKSHIEPAIHNHLKNSAPGTKAISIVKEVTKALWKDEDEETKAEVAKVVANALDMPIEPEEGDSSEWTAQQYQE